MLKFMSEKKKQVKQRQKGHAKQQSKPKQPTVENATDISTDGEEEIRSGIKQVRKVSQSKKNEFAEILKIVENAAKALTAFGSCEKIEALLQTNDIEQEKTIDNLRKYCLTIANLLPESKSASKFSAENIPSTIGFYDQSFVYRASSNLLYLLKPMEVFKGNVNYNRRKVFGFIRRLGAQDPAMCAMPGWTVCAEKHYKLLDPNLWTTIVKDFVNFHNHDFRVSPFDKHHGREGGDTYAAHVEPRLMLWFAIDVLQKQSGKISHPSKQRGDLWMLRNLVRKTIEAEVVLSRPPCRECLTFQEFLERYTPIKFSFIVCKNLGEVKFVRNKHKQVSLPLFAEEIQDSEVDSEADSQPQMGEITEIKKRSNIAVIIRQKPSAHAAASIPVPLVTKPAERRQSMPSEVSIRTTMTTDNNSSSRVSTRITVSQATHLNQYYFPVPKISEKKTRRERNYFRDSDEDDWMPPSRPGSKSRNENMFTPLKKNTKNCLPTPAFTSDALERSKNLKNIRKRPREMDIFQTPSKKACPSKY